MNQTRVPLQYSMPIRLKLQNACLTASPYLSARIAQRVLIFRAAAKSSATILTAGVICGLMTKSRLTTRPTYAKSCNG